MYKQFLSAFENVILSSKREIEDVELVAVSKKKSIDDIQTVIDQGHISFGEDYLETDASNADGTDTWAFTYVVGF